MKINTDEKKINEILERGTENVLVKDELKQKLLSGKRLKIYFGIDPTGPTLHIGHIIGILKLRQFQKLGHKVILLVGDFTAMVGDPTDKMATRKQLTEKEVKENLKLYKKQISTFLDFEGTNKAEFRFNSEWLSKMSFKDVLSFSSLSTVDQMLKRDMFQKRQEEGKHIFIHEFMYPLMQGIDSVFLDVDVEVGGNDQTFNMLMGRHLMQKLKNKNKDVISMQLLVDNTGKKMGKTEGNMVSLKDSKEEIFGKVMSWEDSLIMKAFVLCTILTNEEIKKIEIENKNNPKELKKVLAFEITKMIYGEKNAEKAKEDWVSKFEKKEIPENIEEIKGGGFLGELLLSNKIVKSMSDWRRLVDEGAVKILFEDKEEKITNHKEEAKKGVYKIGKKRFIKIT